MFSYKQKRSLAILVTIITILSFLCLVVTVTILLVVKEKIPQYVFFIQAFILFILFINSLIKVNSYVKTTKKSYLFSSNYP